MEPSLAELQASFESSQAQVIKLDEEYFHATGEESERIYQERAEWKNRSKNLARQMHGKKV